MNENSFYSLDKLVAFGLGSSVADQLSESMNKSIQQMKIPGAGNSTVQPHGVSYYIAVEGNAVGPYTLQELARFCIDGNLTHSSLVWQPEFEKWRPVSDCPELLQLIALTPPIPQ